MASFEFIPGEGNKSIIERILDLSVFTQFSHFIYSKSILFKIIMIKYLSPDISPIPVFVSSITTYMEFVLLENYDDIKFSIVFNDDTESFNSIIYRNEMEEIVMMIEDKLGIDRTHFDPNNYLTN